MIVVVTLAIFSPVAPSSARGGTAAVLGGGASWFPFRWSGSPPALHHFPGVAPRPSRRCIRHGSRRGFHLDGSRGITSFWSSPRWPRRDNGRNDARSADHCVLAGLAGSASAPRDGDVAGVNFLKSLLKSHIQFKFMSPFDYL